jgi:hypothetical protein
MVFSKVQATPLSGRCWASLAKASFHLHNKQSVPQGGGPLFRARRRIRHTGLTVEYTVAILVCDCCQRFSCETRRDRFILLPVLHRLRPFRIEHSIRCERPFAVAAFYFLLPSRILWRMPSIGTFSRDEPTHATSWIVNITLASRNEMYTAVQNCLANIKTIVCADVEAAYSGVSFHDRCLHFLPQGMQSIDLRLVQIEIKTYSGRPFIMR